MPPQCRSRAALRNRSFERRLHCGAFGPPRHANHRVSRAQEKGNGQGKRAPRHILDSVAKFRVSGDLKDVLGETFVLLYSDVKNSEHDAYQQVISPWERQHLLLNV